VSAARRQLMIELAAELALVAIATGLWLFA